VSHALGSRSSDSQPYVCMLNSKVNQVTDRSLSWSINTDEYHTLRLVASMLLYPSTIDVDTMRYPVAITNTQFVSQHF
jgi:hypothetical protein